MMASVEVQCGCEMKGRKVSKCSKRTLEGTVSYSSSRLSSKGVAEKLQSASELRRAGVRIVVVVCRMGIASRSLQDYTGET